MNNSIILASFTPEALNNWMLLFFATLFAGTILFLIGLLIGRRFWNRFELVTDHIDRINQKQTKVLLKKRRNLDSIQQSVEIAK